MVYLDKWKQMIPSALMQKSVHEHEFLFMFIHQKTQFMGNCYVKERMVKDLYLCTTTSYEISNKIKIKDA